MFFKQKDNFSQLSDADLVERYRHSHDTKYLGHLYLRYSHLVLGLCLKYFKNEATAQDAVMDIYEKIVSELKKHNVENFKPWLYTLSKNHCLQVLRKDKVKFKKESAFEVFLSNYVESDVEMHLIERKEKEALLSKLEEVLPQLKNMQYKCVKAFYLENKTYQNIAEEFDISIKEVKSNIQNGKRNLKIKMTEK